MFCTFVYIYLQEVIHSSPFTTFHNRKTFSQGHVTHDLLSLSLHPLRDVTPVGWQSAFCCYGLLCVVYYSCVFHQLTGRVCSTRLRPYCLIWTLIIQLGQPLTRSAYRHKTGRSRSTVWFCGGHVCCFF